MSADDTKAIVTMRGVRSWPTEGGLGSLTYDVDWPGPTSREEPYLTIRRGAYGSTQNE